MGKHLLIVESPAKARTLKKYLGAGFDVLASYGHVRDLRPKEGAVEPDSGFTMHYTVIEKNARHLSQIVRGMRDADALYLATDPDREGEAISWHLVELLKEHNVLDAKPVYRVVFHEITQRAVEEALADPRGLSMELVNAQQARRALDYLVGFNLSPLLWKKIRRGLSAGRVQSPALRLIVERETEIEHFVRREYWTIEADLAAQEQPFHAKLSHYRNQKLGQFSIGTAKDAREAERSLLAAAAPAPPGSDALGSLIVLSVEKKQRRRNPAPPFTTSTLQQEAARKLGFTAQRTMRTAQQLYEGVQSDSGPVGLITYMRTDSVTLAQEAVTSIRGYIREQFGAHALPKTERTFKTKAKNAQEAHEAIRPTSIEHTPDAVRAHLTPEQFKLYQLIWKRTLACQMIHATIDTVAVELGCGPQHRFRATGSTLVDPGFLAVYEEGVDDRQVEPAERRLPLLKEGDQVALLAIRPEQHFTEPPPRYSEATLVKSLEEYGIGRPSTYAVIISTLLQREYVTLENKRFVPTDVGRIVNHFLTQHFGHYVDYDFTAHLEDDLDAISRGEKEWIPVLRNFWEPFSEQVKEKESSVSRKDVGQPRVLGIDPKSSQTVSVRMGRYGPYVQIDAPEGQDKPRFAGLRPGQRMNAITLEEALDLFKLPRELGSTPQGELVTANVGRFGPYVRHGDKFISLAADDDPYTVTLERALTLIDDKAKKDAAKRIKVFEDNGIAILRGRFGPYITDGKRNARVPKDRDPVELSLEESQRILAEAPPRSRPRRRSRTAS
ncbi:MAG: DNA topoisomerase I [Gammaproteobacteria bacterium]